MTSRDDDERAAEHVLIDGRWVESQGRTTFAAIDPTSRRTLPQKFPVSSWHDCDVALNAAVRAFAAMRQLPTEQRARFLDCFADLIEESSEDLVRIAVAETGLPAQPRLAEVELPRTTDQLRQAAAGARDGAWQLITIDRARSLCSWYDALGPVAVFGPNNFPFAFGSISGGDFAAAVAAGNPVIAKANSSHPAITQRFAQLAARAVEVTGMPPATVQLIYRLDHADGCRLVADPRLGGSGYTGSRSAGLVLKEAADRAGKPIYLELSSVNPVVVLPGALSERRDDIAAEFAGSCLLGAGQFCTNPGFVLLINGSEAREFLASVTARFAEAPCGTLLSPSVQRNLKSRLRQLIDAGARCLTGGPDVGGQDSNRCCCANTLLQVAGARFLEQPKQFQCEAFGNASLVVLVEDSEQLVHVLEQLEGNLTGTIYASTSGADDELYPQVADRLQLRVGRLLNDKMPTGVAVSPAMNHGGPFPATGHPGFTAVGLPASIRRFARLQCFDNVPPCRLPVALRDAVNQQAPGS